MASPGLRARAAGPRGPADGRLPVPRRPSEPVLASSLARRPGRGRMADSFNDGLGCRIGYLLLPRFSMMSFTAAVEPLRSVNRLLGRDHYEWILVTADGGPVTASNDIAVVPHAGVGDDQRFARVVVCAGPDPLPLPPPLEKRTDGRVRRMGRSGA